MRDPRLSSAAANLATDAVCAAANAGSIQIFDGRKPGDADTAVKNQTLLAELTLSAIAFAPARGGVAIANDIADDPGAQAAGMPTWFRVVAADGATLWDGSVGPVDCDLNLGAEAIAIGTVVSISTFSYGTKRTG